MVVHDRTPAIGCKRTVSSVNYLRSIRGFLYRHSLAFVVAVLALAHWIAFTWAEYGYFCDQAKDHGQKVCPGFWAAEHVHDWLYNYSANVLSELTFGILILIVLKNTRLREPAEE
jgi:hypothetical protein